MRTSRTRDRPTGAGRARRGTVVALLVAAASVLGLSVPASACACGAYVTNTDTSITTERAAIRWDGTNQDLVVSLDVLGESPDAGFLMPVPAQATLALEDAALFEELAERTQAREERVTNWWPNLGFLEMLGIVDSDDDGVGGAPGLQVLEQRQLGEYTVAQLAANDPAALATWLTTNGYQVDETITTAATPYAEAGWVMVAAKLTAAAAAEGEVLSGVLQPIKLTFPSVEPVYPMRLSSLAADPITVELYVLAPNRMDPAFAAVPGDAPTLTYAGWIDPANIGPTSRIGQWLTAETFLTRYDQTLDEPAAIRGDYTFVQAPEDETFQTVIFVDRDLGWVTGGLIAVLVLTLLAVVPTRILYRRRIRAERAGLA